MSNLLWQFIKQANVMTRNVVKTIRIMAWKLKGFAEGAVLTAIYLLRRLKMRFVAVVASKSNTLFGTLIKLVWRGAVILTAMITRFTMVRSLWLGIGRAVTKIALTLNTSTRRGKHRGNYHH